MLDYQTIHFLPRINLPHKISLEISPLVLLTTLEQLKAAKSAR